MHVEDDVSRIPDATRRLVRDYLIQLTGIDDFTDDSLLAHDLGMDSLAGADLLIWLQSEFGFAPVDVDSVRTVSDVMLAACGEAVSVRDQTLKEVPVSWFDSLSEPMRPDNLKDMTITQAFLYQARRSPDTAIIADQLVGTRTFLNGIVRTSSTRQLTFLRLVVSGAEKCPARIYDTLARRCPQTIVLEGYGVTECSPVISVNHQDEFYPGTIGRVMSSLQYAIVDENTHQLVEPGQKGMLLVRGPSVFDGYLHYDGPSPFVTFSGKSWYRTGDLVWENDLHVLTFSGRLKRFIKLGGEMISLPAIEAVLEHHYTSSDDEGPVLAITATPDDDRPEIILFTTKPLKRTEVNNRIRASGLSALHNIRQVIQIDELLLLGTGKTDYRALTERLKKTS